MHTTDPTPESQRETAPLSLEYERALLLAREQAARAEAEQARHHVTNILESITDAFFALDRQWRFTYLNRQAERLLLRTRQELLGKNVWEEYPDAVTMAFYREYHRAMAENLTVEFDEFYPPLNSWFHVHAYPSPDGLAVYFHDTTARRQADEKLRDYTQRLQALSRRLLEVQEVERRHFARELHDEIGQYLTGLKLTLETGARLPAHQMRAALGEAQELVKDLTSRVRDLSVRLRPRMLDDLGLLPALAWHFERYTALTRVQVIFECGERDRRFPPEVETAVYRIVQEALTNVARYACVSEVTVRLWCDRDRLYLYIEDWGVGFDSRIAPAAGTSEGLLGMQERAVLLGGRLTVEARPGLGTRLTAELPVPAGEEGRRDAVDADAGR
jgi:PAS domain S-box-containing protein